MPDFLSATSSDEMVVGEPRRCRICLEVKPIADFPPYRLDLLWCRPCYNERYKQYYYNRVKKPPAGLSSDIEQTAPLTATCPCGAQVFPEKFERAEIIRCCQCRTERVAAVYPQALLPQG